MHLIIIFFNFIFKLYIIVLVLLDSSSEAREKHTEVNLKNLGALWMSMGT